MESSSSVGQQPSINEPSRHGLFDSLTWLDEDDDLDLRLTLDDYSTDSKPCRPATTTGPPSLFRRRLSVNKLSLRRPSISLSRPGTKDSSFTEQPSIPGHTRRKSRALSLITPRHAPPASVTSIDPTAAHYQDPEARHKLRAYLASPQKFDEALEFGFPASNPIILSGDTPGGTGSFSHGLFMASSERLKTFLADDRSSIYSVETSIPDPDSPKTPDTPDNQPHGAKPFHLLGTSNTFPALSSESCGQGRAASREMTLRMTLTRPDLRSGQEETYGWPKGVVQRQPSRSSQSRALRVDTPVSTSDNKDATKESMDQMFADIDRELSSSSEGLVKRFWNRVRRG